MGIKATEKASHWACDEIYEFVGRANGMDFDEKGDAGYRAIEKDRLLGNMGQVLQQALLKG